MQHIIIPYSAQKQTKNDIIFVRIRILCEGGIALWTDTLTEKETTEILSECDLQIIQKSDIKHFSVLPLTAHFYEVTNNTDIQEWLDIAENSTDLCWRTFILVLKKSNDQTYFFYLPIPDKPIFSVLSNHELFKSILKVCYDINID